MHRVSSVLIWIAVTAGFTWFAVFLRMLADLNDALPMHRRIPWERYRYHYQEILQLHRQQFPRSKLRVLWHFIGILSVVLIAVVMYLRETKTG